MIGIWSVNFFLGPAVCTEFWVHWFTSWGQTNGNSPDPTSVVENLNYMYYQWNASVNFYMVHGGTNFGFMNGAGVRINANLPPT